jgi:TetR/AcrR family transcriptional regulator, copper-responsive repressor
MQTGPGHPTGCMVTLSATICSDQAAALRELTSAERQVNRQLIEQCVRSAIGSGELRADTDAVGLATLFEGLLLGISLMARDGVSGPALDAAITSALASWDHYLSK